MGKVGNAGRERDKLREYPEITLFLARHKQPRNGNGKNEKCLLLYARPYGQEGQGGL